MDNIQQYQVDSGSTNASYLHCFSQELMNYVFEILWVKISGLICKAAIKASAQHFQARSKIQK